MKLVERRAGTLTHPTETSLPNDYCMPRTNEGARKAIESNLNASVVRRWLFFSDGDHMFALLRDRCFFATLLPLTAQHHICPLAALLKQCHVGTLALPFHA